MAVEHDIIRDKSTGNIISQYTEWQDIVKAPNLVTQEELLGKDMTWAGVDVNPKLEFGETAYKEVNGIIYLYCHMKLAETPTQPILFHVPPLAGKVPTIFLWQESHPAGPDVPQAWDRHIKLNPDGSVEQWNLQASCEVSFTAAIPMNFN